MINKNTDVFIITTGGTITAVIIIQNLNKFFKTHACMSTAFIVKNHLLCLTFVSQGYFSAMHITGFFYQPYALPAMHDCISG